MTAERKDFSPINMVDYKKVDKNFNTNRAKPRYGSVTKNFALPNALETSAMLPKIRMKRKRNSLGRPKFSLQHSPSSLTGEVKNYNIEAMLRI